ncbi:internal scaffolding protein [Sigmofec virus UA08Rod_5667]|uniref:Internal scaffolding protein n=1 Tax=Sigmofec virus UA08Rod_5667 TaxID=2929435 RepID=A0A976N1B6_9VIRU|nr:internal scaffolding protein [Sigmofec virus UA08Rod_5667]
MFNTQFSMKSRIFKNPGQPFKLTYQAAYDVNGTLQLYESGQEDLYDYIQSFKDSVDIHVILKRFAAGETDVLSQVQGFYADAADMPSTYQEVLNAVIAGETVFNQLPAEIKQKFGNSFSQWLVSFESPDFSVKMGWTKPDLTDSQVQDFSISSSTTTPTTTSPTNSSDVSVKEDLK